MAMASFNVSASPNEQTKIKQIAQLAEYVGVDYVAAVGNGEILDPDEYQEMTEFSHVIIEQAGQLSSQTNEFDTVKAQAKTLHTAIANKASVADVRAASSALRESLLTFMPQLSLPTSLLPVEQTKALFATNCSMCHGPSGQGDGPLAKNLSPEPTNFTDEERATNRSLMGLFDAVSNGIDDTPMVAFTQFNEQQRWSLAFYVGSLAFKDVQKPQNVEQNITASQIVNLNPAQLSAGQSEAQAHYVKWLRGNPEQLFSANKNPITVTRTQLLAAQAAHAKGNYSQASDLAISAYLDGFELVENNLNAYDETLRKNIEVQLMNLRQTFKNEKDTAVVAEKVNAALTQLAKADSMLNETKLTDGALLSASLIILLREGLEALLVIIALMTVLIKTKRQDALKYVHVGWVTALIAGGLTWAAAQTLIEISGASREVMEGAGALFAAVILLYVGVWMHSKTSAQQWQKYIKDNIDKRLESGTLWGLAGLSFIAVYREVFETVLFYQSLLTQSSPAQYSSIASGFAIAVAILAIITWVLIKYSIKLPVAKFFAITTYLLFALSFVLMGKAVIALQEADIIGIASLPMSFEIAWLGIKSTWQGIVAQVCVFAIFSFYIFKSKNQ
ncbi:MULTISPECIES: cytochrome c/FTR1 family iron permease [unclassified Pseudoalteromonas]|uniref:cytochrome c/FTR1 family iron permease n=1 Tax=unclassified Pseudoalteromonas TaxID=194690 RepID=UPI0015FF4ADB|nr:MULTISPECIES: cytochrome c/FTR1 family iron permease [unclassified Pseudoalteromonas]MBB1347616.1 FTR1 family protein [Pseudoalteromonas sp. SG45-2]MBB1401097.1 FTR1 family protein [Pseudoalteromonas sp. SG45-1]MBB1429569.1 FTR1 family protein [Pseudoalteromonas sp. SG43-4]MBB1450321.1 FTR1 family protein [Pseudoalteromonas sp. SG43-1]